jgi:hypothetical protein
LLQRGVHEPSVPPETRSPIGGRLALESGAVSALCRSGH